MARPISTSTPKWKEQKVITYFKNHKDNRSSVIAERFSMSKKTVDGILSRHLSKKIKKQSLTTLAGGVDKPEPSLWKIQKKEMM